MANIAANILLEPNGEAYHENAAGEQWVRMARHVVPVETGFMGATAADRGYFLRDLKGNFEDANIRNGLTLGAPEVLAFMADHVIYLKHVVPEGDRAVEDQDLFEMALLRLLGYRHRLISPIND